MPIRAVPLLFLALAASSACSPECRVDIDCRSADGSYQQCVEGTCEKLDPTLGAKCKDDGDCEADEGVMQCVEKHCVFKPSCQTLTGTYRYVATCDVSGEVVGTAVATTEPGACTSVVTFEMLPDAGDNPQLPVDIPVNRAPGAQVTSSACAGGTWSSAASAAFLDACDLSTVGGAEVCDIALRLDVLDDVCLTEDGAGCGGATCTALPALDGAGDCE